jgi:RNA polymerase sigma-70 factor (ECF subfamily)
VKLRDLISIGETADEETPNDIPDIIEEDSTLSQEDKELIREYVDRVAEPCSSVLRMFYFDEYTMFSIAKLMGYKSEDVAKSRKNKCMTKLKELIKKGLYGKFDIDTNN